MAQKALAARRTVGTVIQSTLFFTLGFLCAGFLALMVAPAIWRRAVNLTRRRIEASVPLSLGEIQADKDRMRAEFAMATRRLEMSIKSFREKAASQIVEIGRKREELRQLAEERDEKNRAISEMEARAAELRTELRQREDRLERLGERLAEAERRVEERTLELEQIGRMYDEASFTASSRQIELVARETEVEKLSGDVSTLRAQRKEADKRLRETVAEAKSLREELRNERKKSTDLERRLERLMATVSDREEKLDRREKEMARLREHLREQSGSGDQLGARLIEAEEARVKLEAELAEMSLRMSDLLSGATGGDVEKAVAKLETDRERLQSRLVALTHENRRLRTELSAHEQAKSEDWSEERRENALLREQINDLAAEVIAMTAMLESEGSPLREFVEKEAAGERDGALPGSITSLADRVRALQQAARQAREPRDLGSAHAAE